MSAAAEAVLEQLRKLQLCDTRT